MKRIILIFAGLWGSVAAAAPIQVPDNCTAEVSPCLIRAGDKSFQFERRGLKIRMLPQSIVKLVSGEEREELEVLEGRVHISGVEEIPALFLNTLKPQSPGGLLVSRSGHQLKVLSLRDFNLREYRLHSRKDPQVVKSGFATKKDFIHFTKYYFERAAEFKAFLQTSGQSWKAELERQNAAQTKVLRRGIASVEEQKRRQADSEARDVKNLKKVREEFFYRTFHR